MASNFEMFKMHLDEALDTVEKVSIANDKELFNEDNNIIEDTPSLTERCEKICEKYVPSKPTIRVIHHLASSGGTLISKCIASMPNTFVLSEVHPYSNLHLKHDRSIFLPNDILSQCKQAEVPECDKLADEVFLNSIKSAHQHLSAYGGQLVLREHTHSDFCLGAQVRGVNSVIDLLKKDFNVLSLITLRNPVDAYASMEKSGFIHFTPPSFAEYCNRVESFLLAYKNVPVYRYEDFVDNPLEVMKLICASLELEYSEIFKEIFSLFKMSGDSGRSGSTIEKRDRREEVLALDSLVNEKSEISKYYSASQSTPKTKAKPKTKKQKSKSQPQKKLKAKK